MTNQDFIVGVDFTSIPNPDGADLNNGVELAVPSNDAGDETQGKSLNIRTTDSALDTPVVPDASVTVKWKRYTWKRRPFAGAADKSTKSYDWNDDAVNVATFLKWVEQSVDLSAVTAIADNALATASSAFAIALTANDTANSAANQVSIANTNATNAVNTANASNVTANAASVAATAASAAAAVANTTATQGVTLNTTPIDVNQRLLHGISPWMEVRTNSTVTGVEWFSRRDYLYKFTEIYAKGLDNPTVAGVGKNTRAITNVNFSAKAYVTLNAATFILTINTAGTYRIRAQAIAERTGGVVLAHQLLIVNAATDVTLLTGDSRCLTNANGNNDTANVEGMLTFAANDTIRLDHYLSSATNVLLGKAANVHPDAGGKEVYASVELEFLGY